MVLLLYFEYVLCLFTLTYYLISCVTLVPRMATPFHLVNQSKVNIENYLPPLEGFPHIFPIFIELTIGSPE